MHGTNRDSRDSVFYAPTYSTPIKCPNCAGDAHLIRRQAVQGGSEVRTFECEACKATTKITVDP